MKKNFRKKLIITIIIATILLLQSKVFATGGQASGTNDLAKNRTVSYFFELIRSMETSTGTLGKASNINTTNYVDSSGNGIDCHLEKNTEYGTITILAASDFGSKENCTAANNTGVIISNGNQWEVVANTLQESPTSDKISNSYNRALINADSRYVDEYKNTTKYSIPGDGIIETDGWGGNKNFIDSTRPVFKRRVNGFFGYANDTGSAYFNNQGGSSFCRAVVVCAPGI